MNLTFKDNFVYVKTDDPKQKYIMEYRLNAVFSKKTGWRIPKNLWSLRELITSFPELKENRELIEQGTNEANRIEMLVGFRKFANESPPNKFPALRPYQAADVMYLKELPYAGVFNDPRTGKTPTLITLLKELNLDRMLVIVPASLVLVWESEFRKWWPSANLHVNHKKIHPVHFAMENEKAVVIVSKDMVRMRPHFYDDFRWDVCVVDEAHFLRNYKSTQSKAIFGIRADRRYALTGTPSVKHASDIFGILHFLNPTQYPSYWQFCERYFEMQQSFVKAGKDVGKMKPERATELQSITGLISTQRKRRDVMPWMPAKQYTTIPVTMSTAQRKAYSNMKKFFEVEHNGVTADAQGVTTQIMRMRQICQDPRLLGLDIPGAKTEILLEFLEDNKQPVVVLSWFTSYLKFLEPMITKLGRRVGMIHGDMTSKQKMDVATRFQEGKLDVILGNTISTGVGYTLDRAESVIFLDKLWNPSENEQAEDRVAPTTEEKNHKHEIITFVCTNTLEIEIEKLLEERVSITNLINEGGYQAIKKLLGS